MVVPVATSRRLPGPKLPTAHAGCLFPAIVPPPALRAMQPRPRAMQGLQQQTVVLQCRVQTLYQRIEIGVGGGPGCRCRGR